MDQEEKWRYRVKEKPSHVSQQARRASLMSYDIAKDGQIEGKIRGD